MNEVEERLKEYMGKISSLETDKSLLLKELEEDRVNHRLYDEMMLEFKEQAIKQVQYNRKIRHETERLKKSAKREQHLTLAFLIVGILGSIISPMLLFSKVALGLIGYILTIVITVLVLNSAVSEYSKCHRIKRKINIFEMNLARVEKEHSKCAKEKSWQKETFLDEITISLNEMNLSNINDNLAYYEKQVWMILQKNSPEEDTEYMSKLRDSFYPKEFVIEDSVALRHSINEE